MTTNHRLVVKLLERGDTLEIRNGRLVIEAASRIPVPDGWMAEHYAELVLEILRAVGVEAFYYSGHSIGLNDVTKNDPAKSSTKKSGLTLDMLPVLTEEIAYAIFNVTTTRARDTKAGRAGSSLPPGQFRLKHRKGIQPTKHAFYRMWKSTGLPMPKVSRFHERMGKLSGILFTAPRTEGKPGRLVAHEMRAMNLSCSQVKAAIFPDMSRTNSGQQADNKRTNAPDKEISENHARQGNQPDSSTWANNYIKKVIRKHGYKEDHSSLTTDIPHTYTGGDSPSSEAMSSCSDDDFWKSYDAAKDI